jgi:hypothetical protein
LLDTVYTYFETAKEGEEKIKRKKNIRVDN